MFGTSIHWSTFFYLLLDTVLVLLTLYLSRKNRQTSQKRFICIGYLFVAYNLTGGFLPTENYQGPLIIQYLITYSIAIILCLYIIYYFFETYNLVVLKYNLSVRNLTLLTVFLFIVLFLIPYYYNGSISTSMYLFMTPMSIIAIAVLFIFYHSIPNAKNTSNFMLRRNKLSIISITCMTLLPICVMIGDYQWVKFTIMNIAFYSITAIEIDKHLYFLDTNSQTHEIFSLEQKHKKQSINHKILYSDLTRREMEIALSILNNLSYKNIGEDLYIAENTVSKHASNIFKKTGTRNKSDFLKRFL